MLSQEQLEKLAVKAQTGIVNVAREYAQNLFLKHFYSLDNSGSILFKGGTALRILYRSPRFSEDLDFSTSRIDKRKIESLLQETMVKLDQEGISVDVVESKSTTGGFLCILSFGISSNKFNISIKISGRKKKLSGELIVVENPYIDSYTLMSLKKDYLIDEKIQALSSRRKPRDFFDLYFMLRAGLLPNKAVLKKLLPIIKETKIDFKSEMDEFLPRSHHPIIKDLKRALESEIKRYI
jgi:predicted nucleotidyltransferase component of viral defense system